MARHRARFLTRKAALRALVFGILASAVIALALLLRHAAPAPEPYKETRFLMGTVVSIQIRGLQESRARDAASAAFGAMERIEKIMTTYNEESQVSALNRGASDGPIEVDPMLFRLLEKSVEMTRLTNGAFDVTIKPVLDVWKKRSDSKALPTEEEIQAARQLVGSQLIKFHDGNRVSFAKKGVKVDLGGIAKGLAADVAAEELKKGGARAGLVDAGGDISLFAPKDEPWKIGIQNPFSEDLLLPQVLIVSEGAVATSGNYRRGYEIAGKWYSHIVDPRTGWPVESLPSVTVLARDATTADALATAVSVLGEEEAVQVLEALRAKGGFYECLYVKGDRTKWALGMTPGFKKYLEP